MVKLSVKMTFFRFYKHLGPRNTVIEYLTGFIRGATAGISKILESPHLQTSLRNKCFIGK